MNDLEFQDSDKPTVTIQDWQIFGEQIWGKAFNHPRFDDGTAVRTSMIVDMPSDPKEGDTVETLNTKYVLGKKYEPKDD